MTLVDLEYRRKDPERVKEKLAEMLRLHPHRSVDEIFASLPDVLRYTYLLDSATYVDTYWQVWRGLDADGNRPVVGRNLWNRPEYRGVTTWWEMPADPGNPGPSALFEVQFHTPGSLEARRRSHPIYARLRDPRTSPAEARDLKQELRDMYADVTAPPRIHEIPDYRQGGY